ncbi:hypothetical protein ACHAQJ_004416 [Trichoderma viride]
MKLTPRILNGKPSATQYSVGTLMGTLHQRLLGDILCWKAEGEAKKLFKTSLRKSIFNYIQDHSDMAQESRDCLFIVLFMVGKRPERAAPAVMLISHNKDVRRQAFDLTAKSGIMTKYPGFGLRHSAPENLVAWTDEFRPVSVYATRHEDGSTCCELNSISSSSAEQTFVVAVAGGVVTYRGKNMLLCANHFLRAPPRVDPQAQRAEASPTSDSDDSENNWDEFDEEDEDEDEDGDENNNDETGLDSIERTRQGSVSDAEESEGCGSDDSDDPASPAAFLRIPAPMRARQLVGEGKPVLNGNAFDYGLLEVESDSSALLPLFENAIPLDDLDQIEPLPRNCKVMVVTPKRGLVYGELSDDTTILKTPWSKLNMVYEADFRGATGPGDSGSWVRDAKTGRLFGHIVGGAFGATWIMPANLVFPDARARFDQLFGTNDAA